MISKVVQLENMLNTKQAAQKTLRQWAACFFSLLMQAAAYKFLISFIVISDDGF